MNNKKQRPVHLNLLQIRLPIAGVMSIIHRATGMLMFLVVPLLIFCLDRSLISEQGFQEVLQQIHTPFGVVLLLVIIWSLVHHLFAGIRYLLIDIDKGVEKQIASQTAWVVTLLAPPCAALLTWGLL